MKIDIKRKESMKLNKKMVGLFFEDINYAADGGLHNELLENRNFEFLDSRGDKNNYYQIEDPIYGWSIYKGDGVSLEILTSEPLNKINDHYLKYQSNSEGGFKNKAYDGIYLNKDEEYDISFYSKCIHEDKKVYIKIIKDDRIFSEKEFLIKKGNEWIKYSGVLKAEEKVNGADFVVWIEDGGEILFDHFSMIPKTAVEGIFRKDLFDILYDLKPGFLRFPGGCIVEGNTLSNRYRWKDTVKPIELRKLNWNRWAVHENKEENDFKSIYSHYNQSLGLGYYEYFLLCEKLGASPLPVLNVGLACQYQSDELINIDDDEFQEFIEDALDLIEFANGSTNTYYGAIRKELGHEEPFNLKLLGIGNEQWETEKVDFFERYRIFENAIHERYPDILLIGSAGPDIKTKRYDAAWEFYYDESKKNKKFTYAVDEHYYVKPEWLIENNNFYDDYKRDVYVFAGEYAAHVEGVDEFTKKNNLFAAIAEAAFLTGVERNGDVVRMTSYAPLLARVNYAQWAPNLIWFDGEKAYKTPSYYVQKMYSRNTGDFTLLYNKEEKDGIFSSVSYDENSSEIIIKLVNTLDNDEDINLYFEGEALKQLYIREYHLEKEEGYFECNSLENVDNIVMTEEDIYLEEVYLLKKRSFTVLRIKHTL